jgi:hypothetical protein
MHLEIMISPRCCPSSDLSGHLLPASRGEKGGAALVTVPSPRSYGEKVARKVG